MTTTVKTVSKKKPKLSTFDKMNARIKTELAQNVVYVKLTELLLDRKYLNATFFKDYIAGGTFEQLSPVEMVDVSEEYVREGLGDLLKPAGLILQVGQRYQEYLGVVFTLREATNMRASFGIYVEYQDGLVMDKTKQHIRQQRTGLKTIVERQTRVTDDHVRKMVAAMDICAEHNLNYNFLLPV